MSNEKIIKDISQKIAVEENEAELIFEKAESGGEINAETSPEKWLTERFLPNVVEINEEGYARMCIDALKILGSTAASDYGSSRQRDLGQLWADMTRGYLGELAFSLFLEKNWGIKAELGHEKGKLSEYLSTDIHYVKKPGEERRVPKIKVGIKTTKWNGIWMDIPGDQFNHSDVHIFIKVGTGRDHLFAYFKKISVFKDKVLKTGEALGALSEKESSYLYDQLPTFKNIPAYICGFISKSNDFKKLSYKGKIGRINYKINEWDGPIDAGDLDKIKIHEKIPGKITFEGIGEFAHGKGYLFNAGSLLWSKKDWEKHVIKKL